MDNNKRPQARKKTVSSSGNGVHRRGEGLGTGRVGSKDYSSGKSSGGSTAKRAAAGGGAGAIVLIVGLILLLKDGGISGLLGGSGDTGTETYVNSGSGGYSASSEGKVNDSVAPGSRAKRTVIKGGKKDTVTLMVYMCGTDLESKHGMASSDLEEMRAASKNFGDNFNLIVYTGGCNGWKTSSISSKVNQIYEISGGKIRNLVDDDGSKAMTDPDTLSSFIKYCNKNFPANRNELILWDHGGGSVSGYGYDEKNSRKGSMDLAGISKALKNGGVTFDFIGFDACLMATAENALMLDSYADYLIASEEAEPGIGWYYTNWLNSFAKNTAMPTTEIGKNIVDDFVTECAKKCKGQKTTLSVIDLAEFSNTIPDKLNDFARSVSGKITGNDYKSVSDARYSAREFASSSKIDQVDLVHLAYNMDTAEGDALGEALRNAVKYNRTSTNMTDAYGVSIYFPYKRTSYVDPACSTYSQIGMDSEYSKCIRQFASMETSGQIAAGGTSSPSGSLFGLGGSGGSSDPSIIGQLISSFLGGSSDKSIEGLDSSNTEFMNEQDADSSAEYVSQHYFDPSNLIWEQKNGKYYMELPESQWELVHGIDMNMFYYDGDGWVDLGLDNIYSYDGDALVADTDGDWVSINGQPVAYYHTDTIENADGNIDMGYVPAMLNGERVNLIIVFEGDSSYIAGASADYKNNETDTAAKNLTELNEGDVLEFICDFYTDDMEYQDSYYLGEPMTVTDNMQITNTPVGDGDIRILYCFTDIYDQEYWSEAVIR